MVDLIVRRHWWWTPLVLAAACVSAFDITWRDSGVTVAFRVGAPTVILVALIWLPSLIRLLAATGGSLKTPVGEVSYRGLGPLFENLPPELAQNVLAPSAAALQEGVKALPVGPQRDAAESALSGVREQLTRTAERADQPLEARFAEWAASYERIRGSMAAGPERTRQLTALTELARAAVTASSDGATWLTERLAAFDEAGGGERVMVLAALSGLPLAAGLAPVSRAIRDPRSAFEQYHALIAARALVGQLDRAQRDQLTVTIQAVLDDPARRFSTASDRWVVARSCLQALAGG